MKNRSLKKQHKNITSHKKNQVSEARSIALFILNIYSQSHQMLDKIIENNSHNLETLSKRDLALSNYLIYGVIRWHKKLDWIIKTLSKKQTNKTSPIVLNIIRLGLFQIFFMNRIPKFAAVNTSVNLAKTFPKSISGYINAILRNAIRNYEIINMSTPSQLSINQLSIAKSFPEWILSRWSKRFGYNETCKLCDATNSIPDIHIRTNTLKTTKSDLKLKINGEAEKISNFSLIPNSLKISSLNRSIVQMTAFSKGLFSVQDGAAQMVTYLLSPKPGEIILDACSGLGGKATHMAQLMCNQGKIIAVDKTGQKLNRLAIDIKRLGIKIIQIKKRNLEIKINQKDYPQFDRILLDAPCSGLGVIRRNPDTKWSSTIKQVMRCSKKQIHLLKNISTLVKPQGTIAYSVCSTEPEENENVINSFLGEKKNFEIHPKCTQNTHQVRTCLGKDGFFRTYPHIHKTDSFFIALLKRKY